MQLGDSAEGPLGNKPVEGHAGSPDAVSSFVSAGSAESAAASAPMAVEREVFTRIHPIQLAETAAVKANERKWGDQTGDGLFPSCPLRRVRRQAHMNENGQLVPDDGIEIRGARAVLSVGCARRFRRYRSFHIRTPVHRAAKGFTHRRRLTVFVLNHRRPVSTGHCL
jgi:hypothetical protein